MGQWKGYVSTLYSTTTEAKTNFKVKQAQEKSEQKYTVQGKHPSTTAHNKFDHQKKKMWKIWQKKVQYFDLLYINQAVWYSFNMWKATTSVSDYQKCINDSSASCQYRKDWIIYFYNFIPHPVKPWRQKKLGESQVWFNMFKTWIITVNELWHWITHTTYITQITSSGKRIGATTLTHMTILVGAIPILCHLYIFLITPTQLNTRKCYHLSITASK